MTACARLLLPLLVTLAACSHTGRAPGLTPSAGEHRYSSEIIVRTAENFRHAGEVAAFVEKAAENQVAVINLLVKQDEDGQIESGQVYYRSAIAPIAPGYADFDVLRSMLAAAHARNIKVRAWIPQFHDQAAAKRHPAWRMMAYADGQVVPYTGSRQREYFVNPLDPAAQDYELSIIKEVAENYPVDGIMLDWLRFDNFNMDLGDFTRREYRSRYRLDPLNIEFSKAGEALDQWNDFRTDGIAAYVRSVRQNLPARMHLGVYILPPEFVEVGQNAGKFRQDVDSLAPMCYFRDWDFPLAWLWSGCLMTTARLSGDAEIVPAMDTQLDDAQYREIFAHLRRDFPQIKTLAWFHHGQWNAALLQRIAQLGNH